MCCQQLAWGKPETGGANFDSFFTVNHLQVARSFFRGRLAERYFTWGVSIGGWYPRHVGTIASKSLY